MEVRDHLKKFANIMLERYEQALEFADNYESAPFQLQEAMSFGLCHNWANYCREIDLPAEAFDWLTQSFENDGMCWLSPFQDNTSGYNTYRYEKHYNIIHLNTKRIAYLYKLAGVSNEA